MKNKTQHGFSLITAIFLLVVLAALLSYLVNISAVQHTTVAMSVQGARALQAARSALEYGIFRSLNGLACSPGVDTTETLTYASDGIGLQAFAVELTCSASVHTEGVSTVNFYELVATASSGVYASGANANPDFVSRTIRATVSNTPP